MTDQTQRAEAGELRQFVERLECIAEEKQAAADLFTEVLAEAGSRGYDKKVLRKVISLRKRDKGDIAEEEALLSMYLGALGDG